MANLLEELNDIRKAYGEDFMHLCRKLFPTLLEKDGMLFKILSELFSTNSKTLCEDIIRYKLKEKFKSYIYSKVDIGDPEKKKIKEKTPYELLEEAGYDLYECLSEEDIQKFRKYYKPGSILHQGLLYTYSGEELCTFGGGRLSRDVVFFAVKNNAEDIKREEFKSPQREDEYGTSVMGIQFSRQGVCIVSIKNRYNHTVTNPDATYGNDLDRIIPGLTQSFSVLLQKEYGLELDVVNIQEFEIPGYVVANDGKYYKYNIEIDGEYYCPGNIIIRQGGEVISVGTPEEGLLIDYFYIDKKNKKIEVCPDIEDSFVDDLQEIEKIEVVKSDDKNVYRIIKVYLQDVEEPVIIGIDKNNQIIKYENKNITKIGDNFLKLNQELTQLNLPNLIQVGDDFLACNERLTQLNFPNLTQVGNGFLSFNQVLSQLKLLNLVQTGDDFLAINQVLSQLELPNLIQVGNSFLIYNEGLTQLELPKLTQVGDNFLSNNQELIQLELLNLTQVGDNFLNNNEELTHLELLNLTQVGDNFLNNNQVLSQLNLPNLTQVGNYFLNNNQELTQLDLPNLTQVGNDFISFNQKLTQLELPKLTQVGDSFLYSNEILTHLELPNLTRAGSYFLNKNQELTQLELSNLTQVGDYFLSYNQELTQLELPKLIQAGDYFLNSNQELTRLEVPNLPELKERFSDIIDGNMKVIETQKLTNGVKITSQNIAQLDKENELTTSEISMVYKITEKKKDDNKLKK